MGALKESLLRGCRTLVSRRIYVGLMIVVPLAATFFFLNLMDSGLPVPVPVAVVDQDHSTISRQMIRMLTSSQLIEIKTEEESFHKALESVRTGKTMGFFLIPSDFQKKAIAGEQPTLSYFSNLTYYVPGTMALRGFKTVAVTTVGGMAVTKMVKLGMPEDMSMAMVQPVVVQTNAIGNPWMNYNYYLAASFIFCLFAMFILQVTAASVCYEVKNGTSLQWLKTAGNNIYVALAGKLLPQTVVWWAVGGVIEVILFKFNHFPLNNHAMHIILAMMLMVVACQAFSLIICCALPNLRLSVTLCSLLGILTFSLAAISFPVSAMYGSLGIFSYMFPFRYFFLIFSDQALNGIAIYYSRYYYAALLAFPLLAIGMVWMLKKRMLNPVYVP